MTGSAKVALLLLCGLCADASPGCDPSLDNTCVKDKAVVPKDEMSLLQTMSNVKAMSQRSQGASSKSTYNVSLPLASRATRAECMWPAPNHDCASIAVGGADILGQSVSSLEKCNQYYRVEECHGCSGSSVTLYRCRAGSDPRRCSNQGNWNFNKECGEQFRPKLAYIFVDVDGVLNQHQNVDTVPLDDGLIQNLKAIVIGVITAVPNSAVRIVLASTWRLDGYGKENPDAGEKRNQERGHTRQAVEAGFERNGFSFNLHDVTPDEPGAVRLDEVLTWLGDNGEHRDSAWIILDDMDLKRQFIQQHQGIQSHESFFPSLDSHVVKTDPLVGLTPELAEAAIQQLSAQLA